MLFKVMNRDQLPALVAGFSVSYEVVGPVERQGVFVFDTIEEGASNLRLDYDSTALPPKKYLLPPAEDLIRFDCEHNAVDEISFDVTPRVLFGLHACDINAINRLDDVFLNGKYVDPYYRARREATLVVGVSCKPGEDCLCHMWGTDEVTSGYDLFLHDLGDRYLVALSSVRAAEILDTATETRDAQAQDMADFMETLSAFQSAFTDLPDTSELSLLMDSLYYDETWEVLGERCLSCGACASVCPTCYCFNIVDEVEADGKTGVRQRVWDSCTAPEFARVSGDFNFRPAPKFRVRNRFYHKFLGHVKRYGQSLCVGCGRCSRACKVGIEPRLVINGLVNGQSRSGESLEASAARWSPVERKGRSGV